MPVSDFSVAVLCQDSTSTATPASEILRPDKLALATLPSPQFHKLSPSQLCISRISLPEPAAPTMTYRRVGDPADSLRLRRVSRTPTAALLTAVRQRSFSGKTPQPDVEFESSLLGQEPAAMYVVEIYINGRRAKLQARFDASPSSSSKTARLPPEWTAKARPFEFEPTMSSRLMSWKRQTTNAGKVAYQTAQSKISKKRAQRRALHKSWTRVAAGDQAEFKLEPAGFHSLSQLAHFKEPISSFTLVIYQSGTVTTAKRPGEAKRGPLDAVFHYVVTIVPDPIHQPDTTLTELDPDPFPWSPAPASDTLAAAQQKHGHKRASRIGTIKVKMPTALKRAPSLDSILGRFRSFGRRHRHRLSTSVQSRFLFGSADEEGGGGGDLETARVGVPGSFVRESGRSVSSVRDLLLRRQPSPVASFPSLSTPSSSPSVGHEIKEVEGDAEGPMRAAATEGRVEATAKPSLVVRLDDLGDRVWERQGGDDPSVRPCPRRPATAISPSSSYAVSSSFHSGTRFGAASPSLSLSPSPSPVTTPDRRHSMDVPRKPVPRSKSIQDLAREEQQQRRRTTAIVAGAPTLGGAAVVGSRLDELQRAEALRRASMPRIPARSPLRP